MKYTIIFKKSARKALLKLPKMIGLRIDKAIDELIDNPFPHGYKKLQDTENEYRIRIGDYRVIYTVDNNVLIIEVIKVGHRKDVYE